MSVFATVIRSLLKRRASGSSRAVEATLACFAGCMSHPSKLALLEKASSAGFDITLVFISTKDPRYNVARVRDRVAKGGHDVPEDKIIARYHRTHTYLPIAISLAHRAYIFDNTTTPQLEAVLSLL